LFLNREKNSHSHTENNLIFAFFAGSKLPDHTPTASLYVSVVRKTQKGVVVCVSDFKIFEDRR
jgi:hypothetical protein